MNQHDFEAQLAANFVASEITRNGNNVFERRKKLKEVYARESFTMAELTEVLDPNWLSPEQIEAKRKAEEEAMKAEAAEKAEAKAARMAK